MSSQSLKEMSDVHTHSSPLLAELCPADTNSTNWLPSPSCSPNSQDAHPALPSSRNAWRKGEECPSQDVSQVGVGGRVRWSNAYNCHTGGDSAHPPNTTAQHPQSTSPDLRWKCDSVCDMMLRTSRECILDTHLQVFQPVPQIFLLVSAPWITLLSSKGSPLSAGL